MVDYDARRGTALVKTLEAYFGVGGSLARAAELLHVHVNTVTQRLERVGQLLGADWQKPERALEVQLALRLHRLRTPGRLTAGTRQPRPVPGRSPATGHERYGTVSYRMSHSGSPARRMSAGADALQHGCPTTAPGRIRSSQLGVPAQHPLDQHRPAEQRHGHLDVEVGAELAAR